MNWLRDFRLFRWQYGPQKGQESIWLFRFAKCDDFADVLHTLRSLPHDEHYFFPKEEAWAVKPTPFNGKLLGWLFDNFKAELSLARQQPELPGIAHLPIERKLPWLSSGVRIIEGGSH